MSCDTFILHKNWKWSFREIKTPEIIQWGNNIVVNIKENMDADSWNRVFIKKQYKYIA